MTASELHRKLLFRGYDDVSVYLNDSPVNRYIYLQMLDTYTRRELTVPILSMFNEIHYQCVKIQCDRHPGESVTERYLNEAEKWLGSRNAALLVYCIVWALLQRKLKPSFNDACFIRQITPAVKNSPYVLTANDLINYMKSENEYTSPKFKLLTAPISEIPKQVYIPDENPWRFITDNFTHTSIKWYVNLYTNLEDQKEVYNRIADAFNGVERIRESVFLQQIQASIEKGDFLPNDKLVNNSQDDDGEMCMEEMYAYQTAWDDERAQQFLLERDKAIKQCKEQKIDFDLSIARLEAKYKAEIAALKALLGKLPDAEKKPDLIDSQADSAAKAIPFTVDEMIDYVKMEFSMTSAVEFSLMLYSLAASKNYRDDDFNKSVDSIRDAVKKRNTLRQTIEIPNVTQFINNPSQVENHYNEAIINPK